MNTTQQLPRELPTNTTICPHCGNRLVTTNPSYLQCVGGGISWRRTEVLSPFARRAREGQLPAKATY